MDRRGRGRVERRNAFSVRHPSHLLMSPVRKGGMWRVQIIQPNGSVRYFGRFSLEKRAREWIAALVCLAKQVTRK
jgi:hypothetical protein